MRNTFVNPFFLCVHVQAVRLVPIPGHIIAASEYNEVAGDWLTSAPALDARAILAKRAKGLPWRSENRLLA